MSRQYLDEERYQKTSRRLNVISWLMIVIGILGFIAGGITLFGHLVSFDRMPLVGFGWILCGALFGFGMVLHVHARRREISAYMMQSQMPLVKEGIKEITPAAAEAMKEMAPAAAEAAREITKGVKEGLKDE